MRCIVSLGGIGVASLKPDFAFLLGRHCDMADEARFLIDSRIPFAIEKPCAVNAAEAYDIARRATVAGVFAAVPLVMRYCPIIATIREIAASEQIQYRMPRACSRKSA